MPLGACIRLCAQSRESGVLSGPENAKNRLVHRMNFARWVQTRQRAAGRASGHRIGSLHSQDPEEIPRSNSWGTAAQAYETAYSPEAAKNSSSSYFSADATVNDISEELVDLMLSQGISSKHLEDSLKFLAPLGIDEHKLYILLTEHSRIHGGGMFPLLDPAKASGLRELTSLLYQLGFSPREVGNALKELPQLAEMSTATMGLRVLRCKAIGMHGAQIIRLISAAPVTMMWEDEYFHQAVEFLKETRFHMPPGLLLSFMCHSYGGKWGRRHRPGATATQFHVPVMFSLCSHLGISDPAVRANAFKSWAEKVGDDSMKVAQPESVGSIDSTTTTSETGSTTFNFSCETAATEHQKRSVEGTSSEDTDVNAAKDAQRSSEEKKKAPERVWGELLQVRSKKEVDMIIEQLRMNVAEGDRKYGDAWMVKVVQLHEWPTLLLCDPDEAYNMLQAREGFAAFMA